LIHILVGWLVGATMQTIGFGGCTLNRRLTTTVQQYVKGEKNKRDEQERIANPYKLLVGGSR
jgi:hypothetical protein